MKKALTGSIAAAWLACGLTAGAQSTPPQTTPPQTTPPQMTPPQTTPAQTTPASAVTVAGCVQAEKSVLNRTAAAGGPGLGRYGGRLRPGGKIGAEAHRCRRRPWHG